MGGTRGRAAALAGLMVIGLGSCTSGTRQSVLKTFFDGVEKPPPAAAVPPPTGESLAPVASHDPALSPDALELPAQPPPRPALESVYSWDETVAALPRDVVGGIDWVKALAQGVIDPRPAIEGKGTASPPFTLATLGPTLSTGPTPPFDLDIEIEPSGAPFYTVSFPHGSHTQWLACASCHPGVAGKRPGMQAILRGESCGNCHGKVSFALDTGCGRCHTKIAPAGAQTVAAELAQIQAMMPAPPENSVVRGAELYREACAVCHGAKGDGKGPLAVALKLKPRDLTKGTYRFRSTGPGSVPTDWDLFRTITIGVPQALMPPYSGLSVEDRLALVQLVKTLSPRFKTEKAEAVAIPARPTFTKDMVDKGKEVYGGMCAACHGPDADGKGPAAAAMMDEGGDPVPPFDFTSGRPAKSGGTPEDIYRVLVTGLDGTPMGPFGMANTPEQNWALVAYLWSLGEANRGRPPAVKGEVRFVRAGASTPPPVSEAALPPSGDSAAARPATPAPALSMDQPPATFPHWFHRVRFKCSACHPSVFQMKAGAAPITMVGLQQGKFCAECHSGKTAWAISFQNCVRCHAVP